MTSVSTSSESTTPSRQQSSPSPSAQEWLANCLLHGQQPQPYQVGIIISQEALRQIDSHCRSDLHRELGGVLLGKAFQRQGQQWVAIAAALPAFSDQHGPIHFTFTADAWARINRDRESQHPQLSIVGWFHTHPDLGVFYSADDVVVHTVAFRELWHIGLVVDPVRQEACFFGWDQKELLDGLERAILPMEGYYERTDEQPTPAVTWQMGRDRAWNQTERSRTARPRATLSGVTIADDLDSASESFYAPTNPWPTLSSGMAVSIGLVGLFVTLCLLLIVILPLERRAGALENVVLTLAETALNEANATGAAACPDARLRLITPQAGTTVNAAELTIIGTAQYAAANRYSLAVRPATSENWTTITTFRRDQSLAELGRLDTTTLIPGIYQLQLAAQDKAGTTLGQTCIISFVLE
ncbi:MAG: Mov34/MPN/PAD-1 family protein [Chloroflexi bacterium]|nr:Mov34/MPN/PAD-1 family protein [Chloroflexota bacterium]MBP8054911.1 Mov34/MPN/PAD-1 family protein [Chloroflexota bacterium]